MTRVYKGSIMLITDVVRLASKALSEKKTRAILTIIGIMIGPMALVMINGVVSGYSNYILQQIKGLGENLIVVTPKENFKLGEADLNYIKSLPGVADATPFYSTQGETRVGTQKKTVFIYAVSYSFLFKAIPSLKIAEGNIPADSDISKCIIGHDIAYTSLGTRAYSVGDVITIQIYRVKSGGKIEVKHVAFLIQGILKKYGGAAFLNPDQTIFISMEAAKRIIGISQWTGILILAKSPTLVNNITETLKQSYGGNIDIVSFLAIVQITSSITGAINFMTFAASLAAFAVAIAGVAATMITSVIERTKEIGVMKALGFTDGQVLILIIAEGIVMSLIGGIVGVSLGIVGAYVLASRGMVIHAGTTTILIKASPAISPEFIGLTMIMTIMIGVAGSIFPAYRAAKIPPAVALRYE